jgi:hypothetical protein
MRKNSYVVAGLIAAAGAAASVSAQITITQSNNPTTIAAGSVACALNNGNPVTSQQTTENNYWRSFNLANEPLVLAGGMNVTGVQFGVEQATLPPGTQTVNVDLFKDTNGGAPVAVGTDLVLVGSGTVAVPNGALVFVTCNVNGAFAKTDFLVVRISTPDYVPQYAPVPTGASTVTGGENAVFFIGSNSSGETAPGYLSAVGCGVATPTPIAGLCPTCANMHMVINVNGTTSGGGGGTCYANCDNSTNAPCLNVNDFVCFNNQFSAGNAYANCDASTNPPILNVNDFVCFNNAYSAQCGTAGANNCLPH